MITLYVVIPLFRARNYVSMQHECVNLQIAYTCINIQHVKMRDMIIFTCDLRMLYNYTDNIIISNATA